MESKTVNSLPLEMLQHCFSFALFSDFSNIGQNFYALARVNRFFSSAILSHRYWESIINKMPSCFPFDCIMSASNPTMTPQIGLTLVKLQKIMHLELQKEYFFEMDSEDYELHQQFGRNIANFISAATDHYSDNIPMQFAIAITGLEFCSKVVRSRMPTKICRTSTLFYSWFDEVNKVLSICFENLTRCNTHISEKIRGLTCLARSYFAHIIDSHLYPFREDQLVHVTIDLLDSFTSISDFVGFDDALVTLVYIRSCVSPENLISLQRFQTIDKPDLRFRVNTFMAGLFLHNPKSAIILFSSINLERLYAILDHFGQAGQQGRSVSYHATLFEPLIKFSALNPLVISAIIDNWDDMQAIVLIRGLDDAHTIPFENLNTETLLRNREIIDFALADLAEDTRSLMLLSRTLPIWSCFFASNLDYHSRIGVLRLSTIENLILTQTICLDNFFQNIITDIAHLNPRDIESLSFIMLNEFGLFAEEVTTKTEALTIWEMMIARPIHAILITLIFSHFAALITPQNSTQIFSALLSAKESDAIEIIIFLVRPIGKSKITDTELLSVLCEPFSHKGKTNLLCSINRNLQSIVHDPELLPIAEYTDMIEQSLLTRRAMDFLCSLMNSPSHDPKIKLTRITEILKRSFSRDHILIIKIEECISRTENQRNGAFNEKILETFQLLLLAEYNNPDMQYQAVTWFLQCLPFISISATLKLDSAQPTDIAKSFKKHFDLINGGIKFVQFRELFEQDLKTMTRDEKPTQSCSLQ